MYGYVDTTALDLGSLEMVIICEQHRDLSAYYLRMQVKTCRDLTCCSVEVAFSGKELHGIPISKHQAPYHQYCYRQ